MGIMKCLLEKKENQRYIFTSERIIGKDSQVKMARRRRKVMKVKTRKGIEGRGCNSIAANKKTQHVKWRTDSSKCKSCSGFDECRF